MRSSRASAAVPNMSSSPCASAAVWARRDCSRVSSPVGAVQLIALASTVSLLAGWRLYLVTLAVGLAMKFGWVALPQQLHSLDVLANNWIIGIAALGTLAEFFADKIAWVDSLWD